MRIAETAELERLLGNGGDKLARPAHPFGGSSRSDGLRDPSPIWDTWFEEFTARERRQLVPFTSATGGLSPDELASVLGVSIDQALRTWRDACLATLESHAPAPIDLDDWEDSATREALAGIVGPQEVAELLEVKVATVWQWRKRDLLPIPARVISGVPLWSADVIDVWAISTGRLEPIADLPAF